MINDLFLIWYNLLVKNISQNTVVFVVISPRNDKKVSFVYKLPQTKKTNKKKDLKNDKKKYYEIISTFVDQKTLTAYLMP